MTHPIKAPKKLIEVALPLDAINLASAKEKTIRHGHPSNLHRWWARRPLASARAVIFSQYVNDPSGVWEIEHPGETPPAHLKASWAASRKRLFSLLEDLVSWDKLHDTQVLSRAFQEIKRSWEETCSLNEDHPLADRLFDATRIPAFHDPFSGGGSLPLEARRLGLESHASDINPVATLISKCLIEFPTICHDTPSANPAGWLVLGGSNCRGIEGLCSDLEYYGKRLREQVEAKIGYLYPKIVVTHEMASTQHDLCGMAGRELTVIAWIWARTVRSPSPAYSDVHVPLVTSFVLSERPGSECYVQPSVDGSNYEFAVCFGEPPESVRQGTKDGSRSTTFRCLLSGAPIGASYLMEEGKARRMNRRLMAIVADGPNGRCFLSPSVLGGGTGEELIDGIPWRPDVSFFEGALGFRIGNYGLNKWSDFFTNRQLACLNAFADELLNIRNEIISDYESRPYFEKMRKSEVLSSESYSTVVTSYLAMLVSKMADSINTLCVWEPVAQCSRQLFGMQTIPMRWDFAEANPLSSSSGSFLTNLSVYLSAFRSLPSHKFCGAGVASQADAASQSISEHKVVCSDPPYYDNIGYADLSDYFYVWLRRMLRPLLPELFSTVQTPKVEELVATPGRNGDRKSAELFFLNGMERAIKNIADKSHPGFPITLYYAFKQSESSNDEISSTGWETFLEAIIRSGLQVVGTWPFRTELTKALKTNRNALASSVVLVCRKRSPDAKSISRRAYIRELHKVLPQALEEMISGAGTDRSPVAPVDLSQAIIGPGMAVFSKYSAVLEADGTPMPVKTALQLINRFLAESDFDADTQFCTHWFETYGWNDGPFGEADVLSRAKGTGVNSLVTAGVVQAGGGKVRILRWTEYPDDWDPKKDARLADWEILHHLIRIHRKDGDSGAGKILKQVAARTEAVRLLAFRLYTLCERKGWAEDARAYNGIATSWEGIEGEANAVPDLKGQLDLFGGKK